MTHVAVFLITLSGLIFEIAMTRIYSATIWYHFAFVCMGIGIVTARLVVAAGPLPPAISSALHHVLEGNVKKVLISMALWLPYLLLSKRVNVTYRHRVPV